MNILLPLPPNSPRYYRMEWRLLYEKVFIGLNVFILFKKMMKICGYRAYLMQFFNILCPDSINKLLLFNSNDEYNDPDR